MIAFFRIPRYAMKYVDMTVCKNELIVHVVRLLVLQTN